MSSPCRCRCDQSGAGTGEIQPPRPPGCSPPGVGAGYTRYLSSGRVRRAGRCPLVRSWPVRRGSGRQARGPHLDQWTPRHSRKKHRSQGAQPCPAGYSGFDQWVPLPVFDPFGGGNRAPWKHGGWDWRFMAPTSTRSRFGLSRRRSKSTHGVPGVHLWTPTGGHHGSGWHLDGPVGPDFVRHTRWVFYQVAVLGFRSPPPGSTLLTTP